MKVVIFWLFILQGSILVGSEHLPRQECKVLKWENTVVCKKVGLRRLLRKEIGVPEGLKIKRLIVVESFIKDWFEKETWEDFPGLESLYIEDSPFGKYDGQYDPFGLAVLDNNLIELKLVNDNFTRIPGDLIKYARLTNLEHLDLSHNEITTINNEILQKYFGTNNKIKLLDLSHNNLEALKDPICDVLPHLTHLDVSFNPKVTDQTLSKAFKDSCSNLTSFKVGNSKALQWSAWSECDMLHHCQFGRKTRSRACYQAGEVEAGRMCVYGKMTEVSWCFSKHCRPRRSLELKDYSDWSKYSSCTKTCGRGIRVRTRKCLSKQCQGPLTHTSVCKLNPCPTFTPWGDFSDCSTSCGVGIKERRRSCLQPSSPLCYKENMKQIEACEEQKCVIKPVKKKG